jgi:hypothetical protein
VLWGYYVNYENGLVSRSGPLRSDPTLAEKRPASRIAFFLASRFQR